MEESIQIKSTSLSSAEVSDITLRVTKTTRLIFKPSIIKNQSDPEASVRGQFIFQKKKPSENWEDCNSLLLSKLKGGEWVKLELKSAEIKKLLDKLPLLKEFYKKHGIPWGESYFRITDESIPSVIQQLVILQNTDSIIQALEKFDDSNNLSEALLLGLQTKNKQRAITQFEEKLTQNHSEYKWQKWFKGNSWILGNEFAKILDERKIDIKNIPDYLAKAYDGFLDIIEIKKPDMSFWTNTTDHNNIVPSMDLIKAITQATIYIYDLEREMNSDKFQERTQGIKIIKPRCTLICGKSHDWRDEHHRAYRILNSCYHNLTIMTYDHILDRAKRILNMTEDFSEIKHES